MILDVSYLDEAKLLQEELHAAEMNQSSNAKTIILHKLWGELEAGFSRGGHERLHDLKHMADGAMSILIRNRRTKHIEMGQPVRVGSLTCLQPRAKRIVKP
ncbi:hypothetical protein D1614_23040 [Maribellus luteus]|uniref:Uncharacterized protein n=1 Tax=Maribellus luteus TaxID=2305463 RepID=A0A399SR50_9BACT|nr:hypothetical protein [Maribellus luteus]RIJ45404.1 hypothetical protein D1614_23040 [Maribellus luteus]